MLIDKKIVDQIFNLKLILTNDKHKIILSKFKDIIPMYDIYSEAIYPIKKENIYYRLIECDYRFITIEIKNWITDLYRKRCY
jgi:hypothetical protein